MDPNLIDRIYECAFVPEGWPGVLDELAASIEGIGGVLTTSNVYAGAPKWLASPAVRQSVMDYLRRDLHGEGNLWLARILALGRDGFIADHEVIAPREMQEQPLYRDFAWDDGMGGAAGTAVSIPTGDTLIFVVARSRERGPIERPFLQKLDALRPHLARSALFSARLGLERARVAAQTLDLLGLPAVVFDGGGRVIAANASMEAESELLDWGARDRLRLGDKAADLAFHRAVVGIGGEAQPSIRSFAVRNAEGTAARVAHVAPLRGASRDLFVHCAGVLMLTPVAAPKIPPVELLQSLFDLTPAEAAVARQLTGGQTLAEIARASAVSGNTVKTQLRAVFEKTGCARQAELVALLGGLAAPGA